MWQRDHAKAGLLTIEPVRGDDGQTLGFVYAEAEVDAAVCICAGLGHVKQTGSDRVLAIVLLVSAG